MPGLRAFIKGLARCYIAVDCQLLSMLSFKKVLQSLEPRCKCPSRKYCTDTIMPGIYNGIKKKCLNWLVGPNSSALLWSSSSNVICLTTHWINDTFVKVSAVLHVQPMQEAHTGEHIAAQLQNMLCYWEIYTSG